LRFVILQRRHINRNRRIEPADLPPAKREELIALGRKAKYVGNGVHKRNPGDFGLPQPGQPRQGKTLCDDVGLTSLAKAKELLAKAFDKGLVSEQRRGNENWPQHAWAVYNGRVLEAARTADGVYHGYPLQQGDEGIAEQVLKRW
jgi:hypothetical protein